MCCRDFGSSVTEPAAPCDIGTLPLQRETRSAALDPFNPAAVGMMCGAGTRHVHPNFVVTGHSGVSGIFSRIDRLRLLDPIRMMCGLETVSVHPRCTSYVYVIRKGLIHFVASRIMLRVQEGLHPIFVGSRFRDTMRMQ